MTVAIAMTIAVLTAYLSGRVHGWTRQHLERRLAYCEGYDQASARLLAMAGGGGGTGGAVRRPAP